MDYLTRFEEQYKGGAKIDPQGLLVKADVLCYFCHYCC